MYYKNSDSDLSFFIFILDIDTTENFVHEYVTNEMTNATNKDCASQEISDNQIVPMPSGENLANIYYTCNSLL